MMEGLFFEIGIVLVLAAIFSFVIYRLRQPLLIAYILTGIVVGPGILHFAKSQEVYEVMSEFGIAFLLFTVGLGLNWKRVKDVGGIAFATGVGQVLFTTIIGFLLGIAFGFTPITSIYLAFAFSFSSTIVIIKLLSDKEETDTLYGRISVGFLLVQDLVAMIVLLALNAAASGESLQQVAVGTMVKILIVLPVLWLVATYVVPRIVAYAARSQELLLVFAIAWCFLVAGLLSFFGFGIEIGALFAGITLAGSIYQREIHARIRPLRDFFLVVFFIFLGTHLSIGAFGSVLLATIGFSLFILIGNPLIVMFVLRSLGYHPRIGFLCGTTVAQISEFSFIVIAFGISAGHLDPSTNTLATAVGLITIAGSAYLIQANEAIYERFSWLFRFLEPKNTTGLDRYLEQKTPKTLVFGLHRVGIPVLKALREMTGDYAIVDFDPQVVRELAAIEEPVIYGDAGDEDFLADIRAERATFILSTIPDLSVSLDLLRYLKEKKYQHTIIVSARTEKEAAQCYALGATYVVVPSVLSGERLRELVETKKARRGSWKKLADLAQTV